MAGKFIPEADGTFAMMARRFAQGVVADPDLYHLSAEEAAEISEAVRRFREDLAVSLRKATRTPLTIMRKDESRRIAERAIRRVANRVRVDDSIDPADKARLGVRERPARLRRRRCPQRPPVLNYVGSKGMGTVMHVLRFGEGLGSGRRAKPEGAARLELFVDLVPPGEPIPRHPAERTGRPWYLRSFTKDPIVVAPPTPQAGPALVVYWARWADATGEVGPFSETAVARVEGWMGADRAAA